MYVNCVCFGFKNALVMIFKLWIEWISVLYNCGSFGFFGRLLPLRVVCAGPCRRRGRCSRVCLHCASSELKGRLQAWDSVRLLRSMINLCFFWAQWFRRRVFCASFFRFCRMPQVCHAFNAVSVETDDFWIPLILGVLYRTVGTGCHWSIFCLLAPFGGLRGRWIRFGLRRFLRRFGWTLLRRRGSGGCLLLTQFHAFSV